MVRYMGERRRGKNLKSKKAVASILSALILTTSITMPSLTVKATTVKGNEQIISSKIAEEGQPTTNDGQVNPPTGEETGTPTGGGEQGGNTENNGEITPPAVEDPKVEIESISIDQRVENLYSQLTFEVKTKNNPEDDSNKNYVKEINLFYTKPDGSTMSFSLFERYSDRNLFYYYIATPNLANGDYRISKITLVYDNEEVETILRDENPIANTGDFKIAMDRTPPVATAIYISNTVVRTEETFNIRVSATDNVDLKDVLLILKAPDSNEVYEIDISQHDYNGNFETDLYFNYGLPYGKWSVAAIYLKDRTGNETYYLNTKDRVDPILKGADIHHVKDINSGWNNFNGSWYYYQPKSSTQHRGWLSYNGNWYYLNKYGAMETGWVTDNGRKYFMKASGAMTTGWVASGGKWYYMSGSGSMTTGWVYNNNKWYYLGADGAMYTGWALYKGGWYYLEYSGAMKTGWVSSGGTWYCLGNSGKMITGWVQAGGKWYYMYENGAMAVNTVIQGYKIGASGAWIK